MSLGTREYSGNMGLKDQQLAMKWVSGANCVGLHLINEESSQYFNQILSISGTPNRFHNYQRGNHRCLMELFYRRMLNANPTKNDLINFLKVVDASELVTFFDETFNVRYSVWNPIVESK